MNAQSKKSSGERIVMESKLNHFLPFQKSDRRRSSYKVDPIGEFFAFQFKSLVANDRSTKQLTFFLIPPKADSKVATGLCLGERKKEGCRVVVKLKRLLLFLFLSSFRLGETQVKRQPRFVDPPLLKRAREKKAKAVKV